MLNAQLPRVILMLTINGGDDYPRTMHTATLKDMQECHAIAQPCDDLRIAAEVVWLRLQILGELILTDQH